MSLNRAASRTRATVGFDRGNDTSGTDLSCKVDGFRLE
jgi:hypothetical protein